MPYVVTFTWKGKRRCTEHIHKKGFANAMRDALVGDNPRIVPVKDMQSCPRGFEYNKRKKWCV